MSHTMDRAEVEIHDPVKQTSIDADVAILANISHTTSNHIPIKERIAIKVKSIINHADIIPDSQENTLAHLPEEVPDDLRLDGKKIPGTKEKVIEFLKHPKRQAMSVLVSSGGVDMGENLISEEVPHGHEIALIQATERRDRMDAIGLDSTAEAEKIDDLKLARQDMYTRWMLDRHVKKIISLEDRIPKELPSTTSTTNPHTRLSSGKKFYHYDKHVRRSDSFRCLQLMQLLGCTTSGRQVRL